MTNTLSRRTLLGATAAPGALGLPALAQSKTVLRISTPAVPDDWHAKMWTVIKDALEKTAPGEFDVQINLNASLFKQGTEPAAMARGNLELSSISAFDIAKLVPEFSVFTAGYIVRDPAQQQNIFNGPIGAEMFKTVSEKMDVTPLATVYLGEQVLPMLFFTLGWTQGWLRPPVGVDAGSVTVPSAVAAPRQPFRQVIQ